MASSKVVEESPISLKAQIERATFLLLQELEAIQESKLDFNWAIAGKREVVDANSLFIANKAKAESSMFEYFPLVASWSSQSVSKVAWAEITKITDIKTSKSIFLMVSPFELI